MSLRWDLYKDGVTFSLLSKFLVCRHRFWLRTVQGFRDDKGFDYKIEFGNLMHVGYEFVDQGLDVVNAKMAEYGEKLGRLYPADYTNETKAIRWWVRVAQMMFPIYHDFHKDKQRSYVFQERVFRVPTKLPSGRTIDLRGKWDGGRILTHARKDYLWLQENKNKGTVDAEGLTNSLMNDLQTQIYANTFTRWLKTSKEPWAKKPFSGVLYNVVKRPIGDWHAIRQKVNETPEEFADRIFDGDHASAVRKYPDKSFFRWNIGLDDGDIRRFERMTLFPILEDLCDWWDSIKANPADPWYTLIQRNPETEAPGLCLPERVPNMKHCLRPHGVYDAMYDGLRGDFDGFLTRGSMAGIAVTDNMFPELTDV